MAQFDRQDFSNYCNYILESLRQAFKANTRHRDIGAFLEGPVRQAVFTSTFRPLNSKDRPLGVVFEARKDC